ncbi:MAG: mechanosensitive ion channel domain-containing protein [Candidatus Methanoperedens sp.]
MLENLHIMTIVMITFISSGTIITVLAVNHFLKEYFKHIAIKLRVPETKYIFFRRSLNLLIILIGFFMMMSMSPAIQSLWVLIIGSFSIMGVVVGLAAQQTFSNFIAGISLIVSDPVGVGDVVTVRGTTGVLKDITFRQFILESETGDIIIIPNSVMASEIITKSNTTKEINNSE